MICGDLQGTPKGAFRHKNSGDDMCGPCKAAYRPLQKKWQSEYRRRKRLAEDRKTTRSVIVDVLVTEDRWLTADLVVDRVLSLHPEWNALTVKRMIDRLREEGLVESRLRTFSYLDGTAGANAKGRVRTHEVAEFRAYDEAWDVLYGVA